MHRVFILCLAFLFLVACTSPISTHVLFIGNSFTYFNGGMDRQLKGLAPDSSSTVIAVGGYTLRDHLNAGEAIRTIHLGGWAYVVLQEQSQVPVLDSKNFFNAVRDFDVAVRASGAHTVLLMTWERPDSVDVGVTTAKSCGSLR